MHRWFHLKEGFSCDLLEQVVRDVGFSSGRRLRILDPFAGGGTTAVSACDLVTGGKRNVECVHGIETNPFLRLVAHAKLAALQKPPADFAKVAGRVAARAMNKRVDAAATPKLTTFHRSAHFNRQDLEALLRLKASIDVEAERRDASPTAIALARLALGASIEPCSGLRRDGRTLRLVEDKVRSVPTEEFLRRVEVIDDDLMSTPVRIGGSVAKGDARTLKGMRSDAADFDLVLFSPPYPNNIDYTEVYKLEAWLLGGITSEAEFRAQRMRTLHSHPSLKRADDYMFTNTRWRGEVDHLIEPIIDSIPDDRYASARRRLVRGYTDDMMQVLKSAHARMKRGGRLVYVVGNSLHGSGDDTLLIASDLIIARLAEMVGFQIERIGVARAPQRRRGSEPFLRESIVFGRKR